MAEALLAKVVFDFDWRTNLFRDNSSRLASAKIRAGNNQLGIEENFDSLPRVCGLSASKLSNSNIRRDREVPYGVPFALTVPNQNQLSHCKLMFRVTL